MIFVVAGAQVVGLTMKFLPLVSAPSSVSDSDVDLDRQAGLRPGQVVDDRLQPVVGLVADADPDVDVDLPEQPEDRAQDEAELRGRAGRRLDVVDRAGHAEREAERGHVGGRGADLRVGRARVGVELGLRALRRRHRVAEQPGRQVDRQVLEVVGRVGDVEAEGEVRVRARARVVGRGAHPRDPDGLRLPGGAQQHRDHHQRRRQGTPRHPLTRFPYQHVSGVPEPSGTKRARSQNPHAPLRRWEPPVNTPEAHDR